MLRCHSERSEESVGPRSTGFFRFFVQQNLPGAFVEGNAELRMTESPKILRDTIFPSFHTPKTNIRTGLQWQMMRPARCSGMIRIICPGTTTGDPIFS